METLTTHHDTWQVYSRAYTRTELTQVQICQSGGTGNKFYDFTTTAITGNFGKAKKKLEI